MSREPMMRGWFTVFREVGVGRLEEISMLVSYPGTKMHRTEASIHVPRVFNHT
jgi:hypothetical protein